MNHLYLRIILNSKIIFISLFILVCSCQSTNSEHMHKPISELSNSKDSISYSIGADIGDNLVGQGVDIDYDAFLTGLKTGYEKKEHMLTMQDRKALFKSVQNQIRKQQQIVAKNALARAESFLSKNKSENPGVIETESGLQYKIIKKGTGKSPSSGMDQVRVQYEGKLIDGTIFDSSYEKGEPFVTRLNRVIKGWTEGIQLMKEGSEYEFFIHPKLAYGERRNNNIPSNSVLLFKVELEKVFEKNIK